MRLEHGDDPVPAGGTHRGQRCGYLGGQVGVVVDERDATDLAAELQAPGHAGESAERARGGIERCAQFQGAGGGGGGVGGVVQSGDRQAKWPAVTAADRTFQETRVRRHRVDDR